MEAESDRAAPDHDPAKPTDDTEGHSLASYEYGRIVANERDREAERTARESRLTRENKPDRKR